MADRQQPAAKQLIANVRVTASERAHLQQVAAQQGTTISGVIRAGLAATGALPAPKNA